jgi:hypothetical protein
MHCAVARVTASETLITHFNRTLSRALVTHFRDGADSPSMQQDQHHTDCSEYGSGRIKYDLKDMQRHVIRHDITIRSPAPIGEPATAF